MSRITPSPNTARGYARDLPQPAAWTDATGRLIFDNLSRPGTLVDLFLVEARPRPECEAWSGRPRGHSHTANCHVCAGLRRTYGDSPHVIAYRGWGAPSDADDAQTYLARHVAYARRELGAAPYIDGVSV